MKTKKLISINYSLGPYGSFVDKMIELAQLRKSMYVCVSAVHMLMEAYKDPAFAAIVNRAEMVTPDGKPLTWALKFLYGIKQDRVAGMDLLPDLLSAAENKNISVAFYGGTEEMLDKTREFIKKKYPKLEIAKMFSPPFRPLNPTEEDSIAKMFIESDARMIFVVLGCPKQERWMISMKDRIPSLMIGIGGALPVLIGMNKRAPIWMQKSGLEWIYRLGQEPKRLFKRYLTTNSLFIYLVFKEKLTFNKKTSEYIGCEK
jgi:N-acetylglucosaminyldiphosphoundecaprenol N-acetyl-beta-D-mannosaminyltransferase